MTKENSIRIECGDSGISSADLRGKGLMRPMQKKLLGGCEMTKPRLHKYLVGFEEEGFFVIGGRRSLNENPYARLLTLNEAKKILHLYTGSILFKLVPVRKAKARGK